MRQMFTRGNIDELKRSIPPYDFYLREQDLAGFGRGSKQWVDGGLCPFHEDNKSGSFKVNLENGAYICFSCGAKGGDIIAFLMQKHNLSFSEAIRRLERQGGVR